MSPLGTAQAFGPDATGGRLARPTLGWREWVALPDLGLEWIKCKVDTGARSSALHAFDLERFVDDGVNRVRFQLHPLQRHTDLVHTCTATVIDERVVSDSGGHRESRIFVSTMVRIGEQTWPIELSLTERDTMRFRMLLGRTAIADRFNIAPDSSYLSRRRPKSKREVARSLPR